MEVHGGRTHSAVLVPLFTRRGRRAARRLHPPPRRSAQPRGRDLVPRRPPRRRRDAAGDRAARGPGGGRAAAATRVDVVGALAPVGTFVTNYAIYPFVGLIEHGFEWIAQETEVAEVLEFALDDLVAGHSLKRLVRRGMAFKTDVYEVDGHMVWGATARILGDLLARTGGGPPLRPLPRASPRRSGSPSAPPAGSATSRRSRGRSPRPRAACPRRRRRAPACRRASPTASAAGRRAGRDRGSSRISQQTIVTPCSASISVAIRSGSPT